MFINSAMFLWQLFLVRLHLAQFLFPLSEQVNGHVPACPIFLLAHPANGRNARLGQCMVYHPAVHEVFGAEAVMVDDFPHAAVNEHIAYGHQATGTVDIFRDKIITQVAYMICQQETPTSAGRVVYPLPGLFFVRFRTHYHQVADMYGSEELPLRLLSLSGTERHEKAS